MCMISRVKSEGSSRLLCTQLQDIRLLIFDLGGVFRDTSRGLDAGYKVGFESEGLPYTYHYEDTWHLRGIGHFDIAIECIKALLALRLAGQSHLLSEIVNEPDAEVILDSIIHDTLNATHALTAERIRQKYKQFFNSHTAGHLVTIHTGSENLVRSLIQKGYNIALLTNGNRVTVDRDVPFKHLFHLILSEDDVTEKKPSGKGLTMIMENLRFSPVKTFFVCDAAVNINEPAAGCLSVALLCGMGLKMHLSREGPDLLLDDLREFGQVWFPE